MLQIFHQKINLQHGQSSIRKNIFTCLFNVHNTVILLLVHDVINLLYYKVPFFYQFPNMFTFESLKSNNNNIQIAGLMIKIALPISRSFFLWRYFLLTFLRIKEVIWSQKNLSKSVNRSKYNTFSPEKYYFLDTFK